MNKKTDLKLQNINGVDCAVEKLTIDTRSAMAKSIPRASVKGFCHVTDPKIRDLIRKRNSIRKIFQRTKDPMDRIANYKITHLIKKKVKKMNYTCEKKLTSLKTSENLLWKFTNHLTKKHDYKMLLSSWP